MKQYRVWSTWTEYSQFDGAVHLESSQTNGKWYLKPKILEKKRLAHWQWCHQLDEWHEYSAWSSKPDICSLWMNGHIAMSELLHVHKLTFNFLSGSAATAKGNSLNFGKSELLDLGQKIIRLPQVGHMYCLNKHEISLWTDESVTDKGDQLHLWHQRLAIVLLKEWNWPPRNGWPEI